LFSTSLFFQEDTGTPFPECSLCARALQDGVPYQVVKHFRKYPWATTHTCDLEAAICLYCAQSQQSRISQASMKTLQAYMEKMHLASRAAAFDQEDPKVEDVLHTCALYQTPCAEEMSYQWEAMMMGSEVMTMGGLPLALGEKALEEIHEALSPETKEVLDDLQGSLFSGPPEFRDLFKPVWV
jgi:hypothetical protein